MYHFIYKRNCKNAGFFSNLKSLPFLFFNLCFAKQISRAIHNKWVARVQVNKKRITIGYFKTAEDAHDARVKYLREHKLTQYGEE